MDVMMRRRELMGMQGRLKTVSGPIVTVNDAMARNAKSLVVNFDPIQASGTPSPDNVLPISGWTGVTGYRAGANLFDKNTAVLNERFNSSGTAAADGRMRSDWIYVKPNATLYISNVYGQDTMASVYWYDASKALISYEYAGAITPASNTVTSPANAAYLGINFEPSRKDAVAVNYPATDTAYHPYSGTTYPVTFPAVGKNLFDKANANVVNGYISGGKIVASPAHKTVYIPCNPNTTYVCSNSANDRKYLSYANETPTVGVDVYSVNTSITTGANAKYLCVYCFNGNTDTCTFDDVLNALQIELGSTPTAYEPYTNTIYGGHVDLVSGVLVADWAGIDMGEMPWGYYTGSTPKFFFAVIDDVLTDSANNSLCSVYKYASSMSVNNNSFQFNGKQLRIRSDSYSDKSDFKSTLSGQIFVYPLATPVTYQLTPQTIAMLRGTNNVWANTNGNVSLAYYAQ